MPTLAKLTRPKVHRALPRERLFGHLDEARERPLVWVVAPPGAGKTTLVSSYVEARKLKAAWYHVDQGDEDIGTFFYYLTQTLPPSRSKREEPLPLFSPAHLADLPAFCRHFFRSFFARLPSGSVLALDNYHELSSSSLLHGLIAQAAQEVPEGQNIVAISRAGPPRELAHLRATERVSTVDWSLLRLSMEETRAIAATRAEVDDATLHRIHRLSDGWAAGIALTLQRAKQMRPGDESHEEMADFFDYFAAQVLDSATPELQEFLKRTALLPAMNAAMAEAMSGRADSEAMLEDLHRRGMFTDRRNTKPTTYQYHDLFRAFLMTQLESSVSPQELARLQRAAGALLDENGYRDHAVRLFLKAGDWLDARRVIVELAPGLLAQGRWTLLRDWIKALPPEVAQEDPWASYWFGAALARIAPAESRIPLERAFQSFRERRDVPGQRLVCAELILTFRFEYAAFTGMRPWLEEMLVLLALEVPFPSPAAELHVRTACLFALSYLDPRTKPLQEIVPRITELLEQQIPPDLAAHAAGALVVHSYCVGDMRTSERAVTKLRAMLESGQLSPLTRAAGSIEVGHYCARSGNVAMATECFTNSMKIAEANAIALPLLQVYAQLGLGLCALERGDIEAVDECRRKIEVHWSPARKVDQVASMRLQFWSACHRKQWDRAFDLAEQQLVIALESGLFMLRFQSHVLMALMCVETKRPERCAQELQRTREHIKGTAFDHFVYHVDLVEAYAALLEGDREKCRQHLRSGFASGREDQDKFLLRFHPGWASRLCAEALSAGIEPEYVAQIIRDLGVPAPSAAVPGWPWPLRISTLGRFELLRDGRPLEFSRKAPKKTLALLKAIIAFGGRNVREQLLLDAFWSDEEGDVAARSLTAALHRLRTLIGEADAIVQQGGTLSLNPQLVWVDAYALEELMARPDSASTEQLLALYRGGFLQEDEGEPWSVAMRERLRSKFIHALGTQGRELEASGRLELAVESYLRGLDADPIIEPFYQGLMRCYARLDRKSEAMAAYRRLKQMLSISLALKPSAGTEKLYQSLRLDSQ
jgi:LuxR family transcriptional regulator, maltose regulon positive regulatory protein